jgi:NADPH:quinone reductase-like Zn-dependent oxidoreductase
MLFPQACRADTELPMILGRDFTGVVVEMGEEVTGIEVGQEVSSPQVDFIIHAKTLCFCTLHSKAMVPRPISL